MSTEDSEQTTIIQPYSKRQLKANFHFTANFNSHFIADMEHLKATILIGVGLG